MFGQYLAVEYADWGMKRVLFKFILIINKIMKTDQL